MASPYFYQKEAKAIADFNQKLANDETSLAEFYARWEALEERK